MSSRKEIRKAIADAIKAANTMAGQKVFEARVLEIQSDEEIPCATVYTQNERSTPTDDGLFLKRTITVIVEGIVMGEEAEVDDLLDDFSNQIETAIGTDNRLGGLVMQNMTLKATDTVAEKEGHKVIGGMHMEFDAVYMTEIIPDQYPKGPVPSKVWTVPDLRTTGYDSILGVESDPVPPDDTLCGEGGCDLPAWQGETEP